VVDDMDLTKDDLQDIADSIPKPEKKGGDDEQDNGITDNYLDYLVA